MKDQWTPGEHYQDEQDTFWCPFLAPKSCTCWANSMAPVQLRSFGGRVTRDIGCPLTSITVQRRSAEAA